MELNIKEEIKKLALKEPLDKSTYLTTWKEWYTGKVKDFHTYKVYNGRDFIVKKKLSLNLPKLTCEAWANLLMNEKVMISLTKQKDNEKLNKILENALFWTTANHAVELYFALGGGAFLVELSGEPIKDSSSNTYISTESKGIVKIEFINADNVYIISERYGEVEECAFTNIGTDTAIISVHTKYGKGYKIQNVSYKKNKDSWTMVGVDTTYVDTKWFSYIKPNIVNNINIDSSQGISVFANAIDQLKNCDDIYDGYHNEIELSRKRLFVSSELNRVVRENGEVMNIPVFDEKDMLVYSLPKGADQNTLMNAFATPIRSEDYEKALNGALSIYSEMVGFGKGYFVYNSENAGRPIQTATGVIAQNSDLYRNVKKHEIYLGKSIKEVIAAVCEASRYTEDKISKIYPYNEINIAFDDSIVEDKVSEKENARKEVASNILSKVEYRVDYYGEDEETARKNLLLNPEYVANIINNLLPAVQNGVLTIERFVELVYGENISNKQEIIDTITAKLKEANSITQEDLIASGFGSGA